MRPRWRTALIVTAVLTAGIAIDVANDGSRSIDWHFDGLETSTQGFQVVGAPATTNPFLGSSATFTPPAPPRDPRFAPRGPRPEKRYDWAGEFFGDGKTIVIIKGLSPRQALHLMVPKPATPIESVAAARTWSVHHLSGKRLATSIHAGALPGGWTIVIDDNGYFGGDPDDAARFSRAGSAVEIWENIEALSFFDYA